MPRVSAPEPTPPARLVDAVDQARAAAVEDAMIELGPAAAEAAVGAHLEVVVEDATAVTHCFAAEHGGYRGWRWSVTLACVGDDEPVTLSEVALVPGPDALVAPPWLPWRQRVQPGDLGVGDLLPAPPGDTRLVPAHLADDPDGEAAAVAGELWAGRSRVLSAEGRDAAAQRWYSGPHGPGVDMARAAPGACVDCGFYLPLAGALRAAFGVCGNEFAPADGTVVAAGHGCGAHSDVQAEPASPVAVAELVFDDGVELEPVGS